MPGPIRNDNRDPARDKYGVPGIQVPTPNVDDLIIVRQKTGVAAGTRWRAKYGTPDDEFNGQNGNQLARLVKQSRTPGDNNDYNVTRVYATDRVNQDAYNAALSYTAQSGAHKIIQRSSLELRATYVPLPDLAPDTADPLALCTQEQATPAEDPFGTLYLRVTRVFENFGTMAEQNAWNRRDALPYLLATYPRITRVYRLPATFDPGFVIGTTTDSDVPSAILTTVARQDESARVRVYTAVFESIPTVAEQQGVGLTPGGIVALGLTITYPESPAFPLLSHSFREFKKDYVAPTSVNAACPIPGYTTLVQTNEVAVPADDSATVLTVTREYQKLPGAIVTSPDAKRLPRALTAIPGTYLNGDTIIKTVQKVLPGTADDPLINGVLSSEVEGQGLWYAIKTNFTRASQTYPTLYLPRQLDEYGGAEAVENRQIIEVADPNSLDVTEDAAISVMLTENTRFQVISYSVNALSPTQSELVFTVIASFVTLVGAESTTNIPDKFLAGFNLETDQDWIDTTTSPATAQLLTGALVISCKITPLTPYRAKRVTVKLPVGSTLPTLVSHEKVGGHDVTVTETVGTGQSITLTALMLEGSGVVQLGGGLTLKTVRALTAYPVKNGQRVDKSTGLTIPYTEQVRSIADAAAVAGQPFTEVTPIDDFTSLVRIYGITTADLDAYHKFFVKTVDITGLPDVLDAVIVEVNGSDGAGESEGAGAASEVGGGTLATVSTNSSEASAATILDVRPIIRSPNGRSRPCLEHFFFVPDNTSDTGVLDKLSALLGQTIHPWPMWQEIPHTLISLSRKVSLRTSARASVNVHLTSGINTNGVPRVDAEAVSYDRSGSQDISVASNGITLKPCINQEITLQGPTSAFYTATSTSNAGVAGFVQTGVSLSLQAGAAISPSVLPASPGTIPTSGLYAYRIDSDPFEHNYVLERVIVVDIATLALGTSATAGTTNPVTAYTLTTTGGGGFVAPPNASGSGEYTDNFDAANLPPTITTQPMTQTANTGDTVSFIVDARGTYPLAYQWQKDGVDIAGATGSMYIVKPFDPAADSGDYSVTVSNIYDSTASQMAHLSAAAAAGTITMQPPANVGVVNDRTLTLSVTATGSGLTYQWRKDGGNIDGLANPSALTATLTINPVIDDTAGSYDVVVSGGPGPVTSTAAVVQVVPAPVVTMDLMDATLNETGAITLTATGYGAAYVTGSPSGVPGIVATWYRNTSVPQPGTSQNTTQVLSTVNGIPMATATATIKIGAGGFGGGAGTYYVRFTDKYGNTVDTTHANVSYDPTSDAPTITTQPTSKAAIYNTRGGYAPGGYTTFPYYTLPFTVAASGDGALLYHWRIPGSPPTYFTSPNGTETNATLQAFMNGTGGESTSYECVVLQAGGNVVSNTVALKTYFLDFTNTAAQTVSSTSTIGYVLNFYRPAGGGTAPDYPFTITMSQQRTDGTAAHGSFSPGSLTSVTHTSGLNFITPTSTYTPSSMDAGHDVQIIATLAFTSGPVTGTVGNVSTVLHVTT